MSKATTILLVVLAVLLMATAFLVGFGLHAVVDAL